MDGHFRAFSFVDRITQLNPGVNVRGQYTIPSGVEQFSNSLVAEAVGQLAAWAAMAEVDFSHRPVAGIAGAIELLSDVRPGQVLQLAAELESVDTDAVGYCGTACADGVPVVRLLNCLGPMVPLDEFDDPQCLRDRFALLSTTGTPPGAFKGVPTPALERRNGQPGDSACATLQVPVNVPFFTDHFPRRPVFPGTLLMHANLQTAAMLAGEVPCSDGKIWRPRALSDVKLRAFISPAETLDLEAKRTAHSEDSLNVKVESRIRQRLISSVEIRFAAEDNG